MFNWALVKKLILKEIFEGVRKLESFDILDVPDDVVSKVYHIVAAAGKMKIKVRCWIR